MPRTWWSARWREFAGFIDEPDKSVDRDCCSETIGILGGSQALEPLARGPEMHPLRAFLIAFTAGSVALFGGYGAIAAMTPAPVGDTITV